MNPLALCAVPGQWLETLSDEVKDALGRGLMEAVTKMIRFNNALISIDTRQ